MPSAIGMTEAQKAEFKAMLAEQVQTGTAQYMAEHAARRAAKQARIFAEANIKSEGDSHAQSPLHPNSHPVVGSKRQREVLPARSSSDANSPSAESLLATKRIKSKLNSPAHTSDSNSPRAESLPIRERTNSDQAMTPDSPTGGATASSSALWPPEWYTSVRTDVRHKRGPDRSLEVPLKRIRDAIEKCKADPRGDLMTTFDELRDRIHKAEFAEVNEIIVKKTRILEPEYGLPLIFNRDDVNYPFDIKADAQALWTRWCRRVFATDLLRGIDTSSKATGSLKKGRTTDSLMPDFEGRATADKFGTNGLVNGQWWPSQLATVRDGAHGSAQAGIYGKKGGGAYSVVLAGGHHTGGRYDDLDEGDVIWYCGTDGQNGQVSEGTKRMLESVNHVNRHPVRVLRSHNLPQGNSHRPEKGYRYDGLYDVVGYEVIDASKQAYRFQLVRQRDQDPIRSKALGKAERPTLQEKAEYEKIRTLLGSMGEKL